MTRDTKTRRLIRGAEHWILIVMFAAALCLPVVGLVLHIGTMQPGDENRVLSPFPSLAANRRSVRAFPGAFKDYFRDNFGFRKTLVQMQALVKTNLGISPSTDVAIGKDGWLFLNATYWTPEPRGEMNIEELTRWQQLLEGRRNWLAQRNIDYVLVFVPTKQAVYPEFAPPSFNRVGAARLDELISYLKTHSKVEIVDLKSPLLAAKVRQQVFFKTDSHMNSEGALIAYHAIFKHLANRLPGERMLSTEDFAVEKRKYSGDLAKLMGLGGLLTEDTNALTLRSPAYVGTQENPIRPLNPGEIISTQRKGSPPPHLLMLMDSGAGLFFLDLAQHYGYATFVFRDKLDPEMIEREQPDLIIQELAEVHLTIDPLPDLFELEELQGAPLKDAAYEGTLDIANCQQIAGWSWDRNRPDRLVNIKLVDGDKLLAVLSANQLRGDLRQQHIGNGEHGFAFFVPKSLRDGRPHLIRARVARTDFELTNSPMTVVCPP